MRVGGAWLVLDTGKGGFKEKKLGTTALTIPLALGFGSSIVVALLKATSFPDSSGLELSRFLLNYLL